MEKNKRKSLAIEKWDLQAKSSAPGGESKHRDGTWGL